MSKDSKIIQYLNLIFDSVECNAVGNVNRYDTKTRFFFFCSHVNLHGDKHNELMR